MGFWEGLGWRKRGRNFKVWNCVWCMQSYVFKNITYSLYIFEYLAHDLNLKSQALVKTSLKNLQEKHNFAKVVKQETKAGLNKIYVRIIIHKNVCFFSLQQCFSVIIFRYRTQVKLCVQQSHCKSCYFLFFCKYCKKNLRFERCERWTIFQQTVLSELLKYISKKYRVFTIIC